MTMQELTKRVEALESVVQRLQTRLKGQHGADWWRSTAGRFADDPVFDEIVKRGQTYRRRQGKRVRK